MPGFMDWLLGEECSICKTRRGDILKFDGKNYCPQPQCRQHITCALCKACPSWLERANVGGWKKLCHNCASLALGRRCSVCGERSKRLLECEGKEYCDKSPCRAQITCVKCGSIPTVTWLPGSLCNGCHQARQEELQRQFDQRLLRSQFSNYPADWEDRRDRALRAAGYQCSSCGSRYQLHVHHIVPISKGGSHNLTNLDVLCSACHEDTHGYKIRDRASSNRLNRLQKIEIAQTERRQVRIRYKRWITAEEAKKPVNYARKLEHVKNGSWEKTSRLIEIYYVHRREEKLYIVAYCHLERDTRTFRLDRVQWTKLLDTRFTIDQNRATLMRRYFPFTKTFPPKKD